MLSVLSNMFKSSRPYIKPEHEHNIVNWRYNGQCDSLYYAKVQSPMCDAIVKRIPIWLAPNLITLAGFAFVLLPHLVSVIVYGNGTEGPIDGWFAVFTGLCFFAYNTLDNIDGKQARRTGTGSPMGMLFDHGLDSLTCVVGVFQFMRLWQTGPGLPSLVLVAMPSLMSYYLFLEEYYMGKLILGKYTGPDDMGLVLSLLCFLTAYYGSMEMWGMEVYDLTGVENQRLGHLAIYGIFLINVIGTLH